MASQFTPFTTRSSSAFALVEDAAENTAETTDTVPASQRRHRGLFLVKSNNPARIDTQARAFSIVAQVERERAHRAALSVHQTQETSFPGEPVYFERETPLVIARRIFHSLLGLARIA